MSGGPAAVMGGPDRDAASGAREIRSALAESGRSFLAVGLFSAFVNLLMLTGPVFMLQVYDRVLSSRSVIPSSLHPPRTALPARPGTDSPADRGRGPAPSVLSDSRWIA